MTPPTTKPSIVIGCGANHVPHHYRFLKASLENEGYRVNAVHLPSGSHVLIDDPMGKDVAAIREAVQAELEEGKDVVLVLHSWSAFVGMAAIEGLEKKEGEDGTKPGVTRIVFVAPFLQPSGVKTVEWFGGDMPMYNFNNGLTTVVDPANFFYGDLPPDLVEDSIKHLVPTVSEILSTPLEYPPLWQEIPTAFVICEEDNAIPVFLAEKMIKEYKMEVEVLRLPGSSHSPFLSMPDRLAKIIRRAIGEDVELEGVKFDEERLF